MSTPDQVPVPYPPHRHGSQPEPLRPPPSEPPTDSYRHNSVRIQLPGQALDVIPVAAAAESAASSGLPGGGGPIHILSGCSSFGRLVTQEDNAATVAALHDHLNIRGWTWHRAALMPPGREWIETGAAIRGVDLDAVVDLARHHGQEAVLTWDENGLTYTATGIAADLRSGTEPTPVITRPAGPGCPMRFDNRSQACVRAGGPWVSRSREVALVWEQHRHMLVAALGCSVCAGGPVSDQGRPLGLTAIFTPSRRGGWQWGPPLPPERPTINPNPQDQEDEAHESGE